MLFPALCVDDFLSSPFDVIDIAKQIEYYRTENVAGIRSNPLHEINSSLANYISVKILSLFYPNDVDRITYEAYNTFQITSSDVKKYDGWVHRDEDAMLTSILYLSENSVGTSVYHLKKEHKHKILDLGSYGKHEYFGNFENYTDEQLKIVEKNRAFVNDHYEETISFKGRFNRLVCFDGQYYHAAQQDTNTECENRLVLISFFKDIRIAGRKINYPISTMRSI